MKFTIYFLLVLSQLGLYSQDTLQLANSFWTMYPADKSHYVKTDTLNLHSVPVKTKIKHGFAFLNDSTFQEVGGKICGNGRENYSGFYYLTDSTLILDPKYGNNFNFKIIFHSSQQIQLVQLK